MESSKLKNVENIIRHLKINSESKQFKVDLSRTPVCGLCHFILNDPYQTDCGCLFCLECIETWLKSNRYCPGKSDECLRTILNANKGIREDKARAKEVSNVKVKCLFEGCDSMVKINRMSQHLDICQYRNVRCNLCKLDIVQCDLSSHKNIECQERDIMCQYCQKTMTCRVLENEHHNFHHERLCKEYVDKCPFGCNDNQLFCIKDHRDSCSNRPMTCCLQVCGCTVNNVTKNQLEKHFKDEMLSHNTLLVEYVQERDQRIEQLQCKIKELDQLIEQLNRDMHVYVSEQKSIVKCTPNKNTFGNSDEVIFRSGELLWKIENFTKLLENAKIGVNAFVFSEPFYSSEFGYQLCLKIYPFGDGIGHGTHLSVFFVIMCGLYDNILSWPFASKIKLSIISLSRTDSVDQSQVFRPEPKSPCYEKPINIFNVGSGSPCFISHESLYKHFMANDSFFIQATILN